MAGPWPGRCEGAVSLSFDDGLASQLRLAVPALERNGLCGTFYLNPRGEDAVERLQPWRAVAAAGHELGNHTVSHPCSRGFDFVPAGRGLEDLSLEELAADLDLAEARLQALDGAGARSFAYPCYQDSVGSGAGRRSYVPLVAARFVAGRARGERPNAPGRCDLHHLWSTPVERCGGAELVGLCERAAAAGAWAILTLHGIDEGALAVQGGDLAEVCAHLGRHRERIWTAPVRDVAVAIGAWRA